MGFDEVGGFDPILDQNTTSFSSIQSGEIDVAEIIISSQGLARSANYNGTLGWALFGDGTVYLGAGATISTDLESSNFVSGTSGWQLTDSGNAEFNDVIVRGSTDDLDVDGNITLISGGAFATAASDPRVLMDNSFGGEIRFYSSGGDQTSLKESSGGLLITSNTGEFKVVAQDSRLQSESILFEYDLNEDMASGVPVWGIWPWSENISTQAAVLEVLNGTTKTAGAVIRSEIDDIVFDLEGDNASILVGNDISIDANGGTGFIRTDGSATAASPGFSFTNDPDLGFYQESANVIGVASGGDKVAEITGNGFAAVDNGTASTAEYGFDGDTNTGMKRFAADEIAMMANGGEQMLIGTYGMKIGTNKDVLARSTGSDIGDTTTPFSDLFLDGTVHLSAPTANDTGFTARLRSVGSFYELERHSTSSIRAKKNVQSVSIEDPVAFKLRPVTFEYKEGFGPKGQRTGHIAEEVYAHIPHIVPLDSDGYPDGVNHDQLSIYNNIALLNLNERVRKIEKLLV